MHTFQRKLATIVLSTAIVACGFAGLSAGPASANAGSDHLERNERLLPNQSIVSRNHCYRLTYQNDGNLVMYNYSGIAIWSTRSASTNIPGSAEMQGDGNFVVYQWVGDGNGGFKQKAVFATDTGPKPSAGWTLVMQNDGNLVISNAWGVPLWSSRTVRPPVPGCSY